MATLERSASYGSPVVSLHTGVAIGQGVYFVTLTFDGSCASIYLNQAKSWLGHARTEVVSAAGVELQGVAEAGMDEVEIELPEEAEASNETTEEAATLAINAVNRGTLRMPVPVDNSMSRA